MNTVLSVFKRCLFFVCVSRKFPFSFFLLPGRTFRFRFSKAVFSFFGLYDALEKYGVEKIFKEVISGKRNRKPILNNLLDSLKAGDTLVVWKIDRLGRVSLNLLSIKMQLEDNKIRLVSLTEVIDTSTSTGKFIFQINCAKAEFERNQTSERTIEGLASARLRGRIGGRRKGLSKKGKKDAELACKLYQENSISKTKSIKEICDIIGIAKATFYKYLKIKGIVVDKNKKNC